MSWFVTGSIKTKKSVYLWIHVVDEIKALMAVMRLRQKATTSSALMYFSAK